MKPEGRTYPVLLGTLGLLFLAGGSLLMLTMLATVLGPFSVDAIRPPQPTTRPTIALWLPMRASGPAAKLVHAAQVARWSDWLGTTDRLRADENLEALLGEPVIGLIAPAAESMSEAEVVELEAFARSGGRVLLLGWVGVRDSNGAWLGPTRMATLLEVPRIGIVAYDRARRLAVGRPGMLTLGLSDRRAIGLAVPAEAPGVPRVEPPGNSSLSPSGPHPELFWADESLRPIAGAPEASHLRTVGLGAILWLAAPPPRTQSPSEPHERVLRNALAWLTRSPAQGVFGRQSESVVTSLEQEGPRRFELRVTNVGPDRVSGAVVRVYMHRTLTGVTVRNLALLKSKPVLSHVTGKQWFDLSLPEIPAGSHRTYALDVAYDAR